MNQVLYLCNYVNNIFSVPRSLRYIKMLAQVKVKVTQSCPTFCNPTDYTVHGILQARLLEWEAFPLSRGSFPTQGSNPGLPHCRQILYQLSQKGSPRILEWVAYPFSRISSWPRNQTEVSCNAGRFFTNWATREFSSVQSFSCVQLFATPWTAACQASLSIINSWSPPKPMSIVLVMPANHLILCCPLLL